MRGYNQITVIAKTAAGAVIPDLRLQYVDDITIETVYPGGIFGAARIMVSKALRDQLLVSGAHKIYILCSHVLVWEGSVDKLIQNPNGAERKAAGILGTGPWGFYGNGRGKEKRWVDDRLTDSVWLPYETNGTLLAEKANISRDQKIRIAPKNDQFYPGEILAIRNTQPIGETISRITFDYDFWGWGKMSPEQLFHNDSPQTLDTINDLPNARNGYTGDDESVTFTIDDYCYIKRPNGLRRANGLGFAFGTNKNTNAATMIVQRFQTTPQQENPLSVRHNDGGSYTVLTNAFDNNAGTSVTITLTSDDYIYIRTRGARCIGFGFDMGGTVNAVSTDMHIEKYDSVNSRWSTVEATEKSEHSTLSSGDWKPLAKDGEVIFEREMQTDATTVNGTLGFWWRISFAANLTASIVINEIYELSGWKSYTISDGTSTGGKSFGQNGSVTFTDADDMIETKLNGINGLWFRVKFSASLSAVNLAAVFVYDRQDWVLRLWDNNLGISLVSISTNGAGSQDITVGTPYRTLYFQMLYNGSDPQTPPPNGSIYADILNLRVYSETGNINAYEVFNDVRALVSEFSSDTTGLDSSLNASLVPQFITNGYERINTILERAASYGGPSGETLGFGLLPSQLASDGKPILYLETWPDVSDPTVFDYWVSSDTATIPTFENDYISIKNWIVVKYTDEEGKTYTITPDDDSSLKDQTSIDVWGQRESPVLDIGQGDQDLAIAYGARFLALKKDPILSASGPIVVSEYINHRTGFIIPAAQIRAGKVVKIVDLNLLGVITATRYTHKDRKANISLGNSDNLAILLARRLLPNRANPLGV